MDWKEALEEILRETQNYSYQRPSRRHLGLGLHLPSLSQVSKEAVVAVDPEVGEDAWDTFRREFPETAWAFVETVHLWEMAERPEFLGTFPPSSLAEVRARRVEKKDAEALFSEAAGQIRRAVAVIILTNGERMIPPEDDPALARTLWVLTAPCQAKLPGRRAIFEK